MTVARAPHHDVGDPAGAPLVGRMRRCDWDAIAEFFARSGVPLEWVGDPVVTDPAR